MSDIEQAQTYLRMAGKDYRALLVMLDPDAVDAEIFGFHIQQAVEKGLKAWLCLLDIRFPKKHDLKELDTLLSQSGVTLPEHFVPLLEFSDFATTFRYDAYPDFHENIDRVAITQLVGGFLYHIRKLL
ncbi:MAG: HEPN domain-containing protein [Magnetococcales bacterium]|nr:HEPN domain-containing protein [Magnetococcales bacterium]MBF0420334.1 HEPN domain-containing protein [Magnetococcales bacterium]